MKKSILLTGKQGSGKTTKLYEMLSQGDQSKCTKMTFDDFKRSPKIDLKHQFSVIAIDDMYQYKQIEYLSNAIFEHGFCLIVATQIPVKELTLTEKYPFDVVECSAS